MVDRTGRCVLVANFASGSVAVLPIAADGSLKEASCVIQHEGSSIDPKRQKGPHAHAVEIDAANRYVFVPGPRLRQRLHLRARCGQGRADPQSQPAVGQGYAGGRRAAPAGALHPNGRFAYLINELNSTMTAYAYDAGRGTLSELQTLSTLPAGFGGESTCAEVQMAPSGRFLYGSNRGHDSIVIYALDPDKGTMTLVGHESTRGQIPRNFTLSPKGDFIAAANQDSNTVVMFRVDPQTGTLAPTGSVVEAGHADLRQVPVSARSRLNRRCDFVRLARAERRHSRQQEAGDGDWQDRDGDGRRQRHRQGLGTGAGASRLCRGARRPPGGRDRGRRRGNPPRRRRGAGGADRCRRSGFGRSALRQDEGDLRPARRALQQCRHGRAGDAAGRACLRRLAEGGGGQSHRRLPVHAGRLPHDEGRRTRAAAASSTTARSRRMCRGPMRSPTTPPSTASPASPSRRRSTGGPTTSPAARSTSAMPPPT